MSQNRQSAASSREDFIKRLFAVTLSVGIASQISRVVFGQNSSQDGHFDVATVVNNWKEILLMITSLAIIVSSWEGYLSAIQRLPLTDVGRFYVDIALVFSYLLLTLSIQYPDVWFSIHVIIFVEYCLWDILREFNPDYTHRNVSWEKRSRSITEVWLLYFAAILVLELSFKNLSSGIGFFIASISAFFGVVSYRTDKRLRWGWLEKGQAFVPPLTVLFAFGYLKLP